MYSLSAGSLAARKRKAKKEEVKDESSTGADDSSSSDQKVTPALLRIQKDLADLEIPESVELKKEDDMNFSFILNITQGYW
jgi:hypothetical protein